MMNVSGHSSLPALTVLTEENETLLPDDEQSYGRLKSATNASLDQSLTSSVLQQSLQTSAIQNNTTLSTTTYFHPYISGRSRSFLGTTSTSTVVNVESNTQSNVMSRQPSFIGRNPFKRDSCIGRGIKNLRSATMSISMLAKPSDDRKSSSLLAGWNVCNFIQGTTILGIPYAVQLGGWSAVATIFIIGLLTCYTGKLLIECMYETSAKSGIRRRLRVDFPEVAQAALGTKGLISLNIMQNIVMFGGVVMYIILLGTVWADMTRNIIHIGIKEWEVLNCAVTLPTLFITKMSVVSWFGMMSVFSIITGFAVLVAFSLTQIPYWDMRNMPPFDIETFPIGFGIIMFSFCVHAVLPNIEGSMKKPKSYNTMVNYSFGLASFTKASLGVIMVLRFGKNTAEVVTVNLSEHYIFSRAASSLVVLNVLLAMPLEMFVVSFSYDNALLKHFPYIDHNSRFHWVWLLISRPLLLTAALLVAVSVPRFGLLMGLLGSVTGPMLCLILPCYCHMKLRWNTLKAWQIASDIAIIIFGTVAGMGGLFFSIKGFMN